MNEKFELSEATKVLLGAHFCLDGLEIPSTQCEFDISKFIRLSIESIPDLEGLQTTAFKNVCSTRKPEECFLITNAANPWVRTVFGHENLLSSTMTNMSVSASIIESNILLYWSELGDEANTRPHFPSRMLQEAFVEGKSLKAKLQEWMDSGENCNIGMHKREPQCITKTCFWKIQYADDGDDVKFEDWIAEAQNILRVTWRGGTFACKKEPFTKEFEFMNRVSCHPNIVCGVCELPEETEIPEDTEIPEEPKVPAYFMEYMPHDLWSFIINRKRLAPSSPPFLPYDTLNIVLQIAKAMKHIHQECHLVHCDLKLENILLSEIAISDKPKHYAVKVADFGSAKCSRDSSSGPEVFIPGGLTDRYAAPEALLQREQRKRQPGSFDRISDPEKIDVYSFGIVAFEVLTGDTNYMLMHFPGDIKKIRKSRERVIQGTLRPPLRKECQSIEFIQDDDLLSLIERCWHRDPVERPSFEDICKDLNKVKVRKLEEMWHCGTPATKAKSVKGRPSSLSMVTFSEGNCDVDQQAPGSSRPHKRRFKWSCVS